MAKVVQFLVDNYSYNLDTLVKKKFFSPVRYFHLLLISDYDSVSAGTWSGGGVGTDQWPGDNPSSAHSSRYSIRYNNVISKHDESKLELAPIVRRSPVSAAPHFITS